MSLENDQIIENWEFPWQIMEVLIDGKSSIDLTQLNITTEQEAHDFVLAYGLDPDLEQDQRFIHKTIVEALSFVEKVLMPKEWKSGRQAPDEILECDDVRHLLIWASLGARDGRGGLLSVWACALLRIVHTIAHIQSLYSYADIDSVRKEIMEKSSRGLFRNDEGELCFGRSDDFVEIEKIEWKPSKPRQSIILKLLHKPANVAETIYDYLGVRLVTKTYADVVRLVKILSEHHIISYANTNPKRSRNSLVNLEYFKIQIETLRNLLIKDKISAEEFQEKVRSIELTDPSVSKKTNPHSAASYKSMQMTCRHMVRIKSTTARWTEKLEDYITINENDPGNRLVRALLENLKRTDSSRLNREESRAFFPYEVQVFDSETLTRIENSGANHVQYKKAQVRTARRRVLWSVLNYYKSK